MRRNTTAPARGRAQHRLQGSTADSTASSTADNAIVGAAVSLESQAHAAPTHTVQARASLAVRIVMIVIAAVALVFAILASLNLSASARFNQATSSLSRNLKQASRSDADLDTLNASQQQVDAQFQDAARFDSVLLPQLREAIGSNAATSSELTKRIERELAAQKGTDSDSSSDSGNVEGGTAKGSKNSGSSGLTDEQKKQVEELLKANQQSTGTNNSNTQTDKGSKKQQGAKPW